MDAEAGGPDDLVNAEGGGLAIVRDQSRGAPSRPAERLSTIARRAGAVDLRPQRRRGRSVARAFSPASPRSAGLQARESRSAGLQARESRSVGLQAREAGKLTRSRDLPAPAVSATA